MDYFIIHIIYLHNKTPNFEEQMSTVVNFLTTENNTLTIRSKYRLVTGSDPFSMRYCIRYDGPNCTALEKIFNKFLVETVSRRSYLISFETPCI